MDEMEAVNQGLLNYIGSEVDASYQKTLRGVLPETGLAAEKGSDLSVVYTPLHGTGSTVVPQLLSDLGFSNLHVVKEQADGDSDFSTVDSPNPEDRDAFELALKLAEEKDADLIIATDPDCDRMAPAVKDAAGNYQFLNGNEAGVLFADYLLQTKKEAGTLGDNGVIVKSIVSTDMVADIAADYGVEVQDVLTGFKFIGEKMTEFEETGDKEFILGFEESLGYLIGKYARDKDAAVAAGLAAIMALKYKEKGMTLLDRLAELRAEYGYYLEDLHSIRLEGKEGQEIITKTIAHLREKSPEQIAGYNVEIARDYKESKISYLKEDREEELKLPKSNVLQYVLEGNSKLTIRPSGTEPKLKFYFAVKDKDQAAAERKLAEFKEKVIAQMDEIMEHV
jgi:phosphoglucomutase